jgi:branched-chain amino acid transport system substrate-binding protein
MRTFKLDTTRALALSFAIAAAACNSIVGLDDLSIGNAAGSGGTTTAQGGSAPQGANGGGGTDTAGGTASEAGAGGMGEVPVGECTTNQQCTDKAGTNPDNTPIAAVCIQPEGRCVPVLSEDCDSITGDYLDDRAILIGTLFSTKGAQAATNLPRQQSAALAVEQINAIGGVPPAAGSAEPRPLVLVSCDESTNLVRAAEHLVKDLRVPAIVGPNTSQDTIDVSTKVTVPNGVVVVTPTAVASSIVSLSDKDLTWLMVPSDVQRAPLMISQVNALEQELKQARSSTTVKLGIVFRNDALGVGTRTSLNELQLNGKGLTDPINLGTNVEIDGYDASQPDQQAIVDKYVAFAPDIVVLAGTAEAVTKVMVPLEAKWTRAERPRYVLIDSTKVPELITAVTGNDDLRQRVRGTGITPGPTGKGTPAEAYNGFKIDYDVRYEGSNSAISGMGPSHDAAYAIGLALAATRDQPVSGASVASGLRKLAGGSMRVTTLGTNLLAAFKQLEAGKNITAIGSFGALEWDESGAVKGGTLEMWCIGGTAEKPAYQSSGLMFDIMTQQQSGAFKQCGQ